MIRFQCNINVSFLTQILVTIIYLITLILLLIAPWPNIYWPIWLSLCILDLFEFFRCQKRIAKTKGHLIIMNDYSVFWRDKYWYIAGNPLITHCFIYLMLESKDPKRYYHKRLWLMRDNVMNKQEWHSLIYLFLVRPV